MRVLTIDCALPTCGVALVEDAVVLAERLVEAPRGQAALLPPLLAALLAEGWHFDLVAASVGPGSFTGLRVGLSLAHGVALASGGALVGVTVGEAIAAMPAEPGCAGRTLWVATGARTGRVFLEHAGTARAAALDALPMPCGPVALAGPAAPEVAVAWAAKGVDVLLTAIRRPGPAALAAVALRRQAGELPPREAQPLYVDPPEAALPRGGLRPPPA